jgi:hypothetical protein
MKSILLFITFLPSVFYAQTMNFKWVKQLNLRISYPDGRIMSMQTGKDGSLYAIGTFSDTVDFDPGPGTYYLSRPYYAYFDFSASDSVRMKDLFVLKLDSCGNFLWAKQIASNTQNSTIQDVPLNLTLDSAGNSYITGGYEGSFDFDPGTATYNRSGTNGFVLKLSTNGNFIWEKDLVGYIPYSSAADPTGNIYTTGNFTGTVDFDPGPGVFYLYPSVPPNQTGGPRDQIYLSKLDANGNFIWAKQFEGQGNQYYTTTSFQIALGTSGNIITAGSFAGKYDFDPGNGTFYLQSVAVGSTYIVNLDGNGNFVWAKQLKADTNSHVYPSDIDIDRSGNIVIQGGLQGSADFDPDDNSVYTLSNTHLLTISFPYYNSFFCKLNQAGGFIWARQIGDGYLNNNYVDFASIALDSSGDVYACGEFFGTIDFDPGSGIFNLSTSLPSAFNTFQSEMVLLKLSSGGNFEWARAVDKTSGEGTSHPGDIASDAYGNIYTAGTIRSFSNAIFDTGPDTYKLSPANGSTFILKMNAQNPSSTIVIAVACNSFIWHGNTYTTSGIYYDTLSRTCGYQIETLHLTINKSAPNSSTVTACNSYTWNGQVFTSSGVYTDTLISVGGCDSIVVLHLTITNPINLVTAHPANVEICSGNNASFSVSATPNQTVSFQWQVSTDAGLNFTPISNNEVYSGATTAVLNVTGTPSALNGNRYRCQLSSSAGCSDTNVSNAAILTVRKLPAINLAASPVTSLFPGQTTTLTATIAPTTGGTLSSTWYYNNTIVPNSSNIRAVNFDQTGEYQVRVQETWPGNLVCMGESNIVTIIAGEGTRMDIFPNPNNGRFTVSYYNRAGISGLKTVTVYNAIGQKIYQERSNIAGIYLLMDVKFRFAEGGIYSVVVTDADNKKLAIKKIFVNE